MNSSLLTSLAAAGLWLLAGCASDSHDASPKTSIPKIAQIGKIRIGYSTQEDLTARWGEGRELTGSHPNSARLWRVKGTSWVVHTDGFEYSKRGLVVDDLGICENPDLPSNVPYLRLSKSDFAWLGGITLGMPREKVMEILERESLPVTPANDGFEVRAEGFQALESSIYPLKKWTAGFGFKNGALSWLTLDASAGRPGPGGARDFNLLP